MTNIKSTKRALGSSVLALFLCFAMLLGTTFAWFTDSVTNGVNKIVSGNLDVELWHHTGAAAVDNTQWGLFFGYSEDDGEEVVSDTKLFLNEEGETILWEPGATAVENFRIKNVGSLALKFKFKLEVSNATKTPEGKDLSDIISLYIDKLTYDENGVPTGTTIVGGEFLGDGYEFEGEILPGEFYDFWVGLEWEPSDVDNEYNVKDGLKLDLGVVLLATQATYEKDDINGDQYDAGAKYPIVNVEELQEALNIGASVKLDADIVLPEGSVLTVPAGVSASIDLNGKSITGVSHKSVGAVVNNEGNLVIKNGTISSTANNGGSAIMNKGTLVVENVTLKGAPNANGSWPSYTVNNTGVMTVTDSKITSVHGAVASYGEGALVTLNNSEIDMSGIPGFTSHGIYTENAGKAIVNGGTYANKATDQSASGASVINGNVEIYGGTFTGRIENYYGTPVIYGGNFSVNPNAKFIATGCKSTENSDGTYTVGMTNETLTDALGKAEPGATIKVPVGTYTFPASSLKEGVTLNCAPGTVFEGTSGLNINGATVTGATFANSTGNAVSGTVNGTFKDCTFTGSNALRSCYAGETVVFENCVFSGDVYGVHFDGGANDVIFKNCTFSGFNALAAAIEKVTMENCTFVANDRSGYNGINLWGNTEMKDCTFVFDGTKTEWVDLRGDNTTATFTNCVVTDGKTKKGIETVVGNYGVGNTIIINGVEKVIASDNDVFADAVSKGKTEIFLGTGDFTMPETNLQGKTLTITGTKDTVIDMSAVDARNQFVTGATIVFDGVTLNFGKANYMGLANTASLTYKNCKINGLQFLFGENVTFENCELNSNGAEHCVWTYGAKNVNFTDCKFTYGDRGINCYSDNDVAGGKQTVNFTNCTFATENTASEGAVEINSCFFSVGIEVNMEGCTAPASGEMAYVSRWDSTNGAKTTINVK